MLNPKLRELLDDLLRAQERTQREFDLLSREVDAPRECTVIGRRDFEAGMRALRERSEAEMRESRIEHNRIWGEWANKRGTLAQHFVAPSVARILSTVISCPEVELDFLAEYVWRRHPGEPGCSQIFDVVAVCGEYALLNETRTRLRPADVDEFVETLSKAREFFPEYAGKKIIGAIASLYVDDSLVRYGEKQGVLVLGLGEDLMEVKNSPGFTPRFF